MRGVIHPKNAALQAPGATLEAMDRIDPLCRCGHHYIAPAMIILIGIDFLLHAAGIVSSEFLAISWPALLIIAGAVKLMGRRCRCCN